LHRGDAEEVLKSRAKRGNLMSLENLRLEVQPDLETSFV